MSFEANAARQNEEDPVSQNSNSMPKKLNRMNEPTSLLIIHYWADDAFYFVARPKKGMSCAKYDVKRLPSVVKCSITKEAECIARPSPVGRKRRGVKPKSAQSFPWLDKVCGLARKLRIQYAGALYHGIDGGER